jgi:hypothetical protein
MPLAGALQRRGVKDPVASLVAEVTMAIFKIAFERWVDERNQRTLQQLVRESFDDLRAVTAAAAAEP